MCLLSGLCLTRPVTDVRNTGELFASTWRSPAERHNRPDAATEMETRAFLSRRLVSIGEWTFGAAENEAASVVDRECGKSLLISRAKVSRIPPNNSICAHNEKY